MAHALPPLPYAHDALAPTISKETMEFHHDKHHQAYVDNLNKALEGHPDQQGKTIEELVKNLDAVPEAIRPAVRNNGGGHLNHTHFWEIMTPGGAAAPTGDLAAAIDTAFGGFDDFKKQFADAGVKRFGSGWAWLVVGKDGKLAIVSTPNQDNPITDGHTPILGNDMWEHAYYIDYRNARPKYLEAWFKVVNWDKVSALYAAAGK